MRVRWPRPWPMTWPSARIDSPSPREHYDDAPRLATGISESGNAGGDDGRHTVVRDRANPRLGSNSHFRWRCRSQARRRQLLAAELLASTGDRDDALARSSIYQL